MSNFDEQSTSNFPFKISNDCQGIPQIQVKWKGKFHQFYPEEISALISSKNSKICRNLIKQTNYGYCYFNSILF